MLNPCELEIDLFCRGLRVAPSCTLERDARLMSRTRAGLGSGLEIILPGPLKNIWVNVPLEEDFVASTPYTLYKENGAYLLRDARHGHTYPVLIPPEPAWYSRRTSRGTPMCRIGVLQGTYLGIYISNSCLFWYTQPVSNCRFCTTGLNVGVNEMVSKPVEEIVEVARAARDESGTTFVHLNSGFHAGRDLDITAPYVKALKEQVGTLVGVQLTPSQDLWKYDRLIDLGADHFSFCYECHNPEYFARICPGKERWIGQQAFFRAMEYVSGKLPRGSVSGEIIAGLEPIEDTLRAIDYITSIGAFPTICVFRPTIGSDLEGTPPPSYESMRQVFHHLYEACSRHWVPADVAPNIEVSLIVQPGDTLYLAPRGTRSWAYRSWLRTLRSLSRPYWRRKLRARPVRADADLGPPPGGSRNGSMPSDQGLDLAEESRK
ncbi:MAG: radical SAM protein [Acidobacteriota bacterium]